MQQDSAHDELKSLCLLYVEDDREIAASLERFLSRRLGRLCVAHDGHEGLARYRECRPDLVLTDIRMPILNGLDMIREIRREQPALPIIISTAFDDTAYLLEAIELGVDQYVLKPVNTASLIAALEKSAHRLLLERRLRRQTGEIHALNSRLQLLLNCAGEGICGVDSDGIFTFVNHAAEQMLGWRSSELQGKRLHEVIHRKHADGSSYPFEQCPTYRCLHSGEPAQGESDLYWRKDGSAFPVEFITTPLRNEAGAVSGAVMVFKDITARKQVEQALAQARDAAEAANRAKSEFLANMSHEIRTPLNSILGFAQLLQRDTGMNAAQREELQAIQRAGAHLLTLINDILDLSKIEARKMELHPVFFRLSELLVSVVEMSQSWARRKPIEFQYRACPNLPVAVYGDETRLRQVLINLLGNAIKFTEQGRVSFAVERLELGEKTCRLRFTVSDTGVGIAEDHLDMLFQAFHQIETHTHHSQGTGLGLAISKRFVDMMGGNLQVSSRAGEGSRFWFDLDLPLASEQSLPNAEASLLLHNIQRVEGDGYKVLIVDDQPVNRVFLVKLLESLGFMTAEADNGEACLRQIQTWRPDVVLLDLRMPRMDGFTTASRLRASADSPQPVLIAVSASVYSSDSQRCLIAGCDDFVSKPVDVAELLQKLQQHLNLRWIERQDSAPAESEWPASDPAGQPGPPPETVEELYRLACFGDVEALAGAARQLRARDPALRPFADHLERLADNLETRKLREFIQTYRRAEK
jgi:PAS domain S-box-containing protein